jgi:hypothetical protein
MNRNTYERLEREADREESRYLAAQRKARPEYRAMVARKNAARQTALAAGKSRSEADRIASLTE